MSIFPRPLKKVLDKIVPFSQDDKIPLFNLGSGTYDATTVLKGDGTWGSPSGMGYVPYVGATQDVDLGIYKLTADAVEFSLTPINAPGSGQIAYDGASGALSYLMNSSNVLSRIGQTMHAYVHNGEAVTITKGQAVYLFSASGNKASVKLAYNTSDATSAKTFGLAAEDIGAGQNGMVICQGVIDGLNTGMYTAGDTLYLGATPGDYTNVKPYAPNHFVYVGIVERANTGNGQIYVRVQNGYEMDEIHDVDLITTPPINGDVLTYNGTLWTAQAPSSGSGTVTSIATSAPITGGTITTSGTIGITQATSIADGYLSATDWSTFNGKQAALVSGTNIKTVNGNTLLGSGDVAISSSITIGTTPITSGTIGRILFENGGNVVGQDSALFWDNTNKRLGIGATPASTVRLDVRAQGALSTDVGFRLRNSADTVNIMEVRGDGSWFKRNNAGNSYFYFDGSATYEWATPTQLFLQTNTSTANMNVMHNGTGAGTYLALRTQTTSLFIYRNGNFHFGASPQAGTGTNALMLETGTAPSTNVTDKCYIYSADVVAGNAAPHVRTENGNIIKLYQETTAVAAATTAGSGGTTITQNITFDGYTVRQVVRALRNLGILA